MKKVMMATLPVLMLTMASFTAHAAETKMTADTSMMEADMNADMKTDKKMDKMFMSPKTEKEFRLGISGPGTLSLMTSEMAIDKASDDKVVQFAKFERDEQKTIADILQDMNTPKSKLTAKDQAVIDKLKAAPKGAEFDKAFMDAQLETHKVLEDITGNYLDNSKSSKEMSEKHGRHLAMMALSTIKQHISNAKEIIGMMSK